MNFYREDALKLINTLDQIKEKDNATTCTHIGVQFLWRDLRAEDSSFNIIEVPLCLPDGLADYAAELQQLIRTVLDMRYKLSIAHIKTPREIEQEIERERENDV